MTQKQVDGLESDATKRIEAINFLLSTVCVSICLPAAIGRKDAGIDHTQYAAGYAAYHARCEEADRVSGDWEEGAGCVSELQHMTLKGSSDLM